MISKKIKILALASILSMACLSALAFSQTFKPTYAAPSYGGPMTATIYDINHQMKNAKVKADKADDLHFKNGYSINYEEYDESAGDTYKGHHYLLNSYEAYNKPFVFQKLTSITLTFSGEPKPFPTYKTIGFVGYREEVRGTYQKHMQNITLRPNQPWNKIEDIHLQANSKILKIISKIEINYTCE